MEANHMFLRATALVLTLAFAATAVASPSGNAAAGKKKAGTCAACHGDGNKTLNDTYPKLAGQYPDYLSKALHEYKSGKRKNPIMGAQAQTLSEQDIADLSAYFGSLTAQIHDLSGHQR
jgi:cytochrome c553